MGFVARNPETANAARKRTRANVQDGAWEMVVRGGTRAQEGWLSPNRSIATGEGEKASAGRERCQRTAWHRVLRRPSGLAQTPCLCESAFSRSGNIGVADIERHVCASHVRGNRSVDAHSLSCHPESALQGEGPPYFVLPKCAAGARRASMGRSRPAFPPYNEKGPSS